MASDLGLTVEYTYDAKTSFSGKIYKCKQSPSGYCIEIDGGQPASRRRFTLAHEIAHYVLHRDLIGDGVTDDAMYRSSLTTDYERQANRFAGAILLPAPALRDAFGLNPSLTHLATLFQVSADAVRIRLEQMGLRT